MVTMLKIGESIGKLSLVMRVNDCDCSHGLSYGGLPFLSYQRISDEISDSLTPVRIAFLSYKVVKPFEQGIVQLYAESFNCHGATFLTTVLI